MRDAPSGTQLDFLILVTGNAQVPNDAHVYVVGNAHISSVVNTAIVGTRNSRLQIKESHPKSIGNITYYKVMVQNLATSTGRVGHGASTASHDFKTWLTRLGGVQFHHDGNDIFRFAVNGNTLSAPNNQDSSLTYEECKMLQDWKTYMQAEESATATTSVCNLL
tara:strand:- start:1 stop:492 length:492 start_codon:yes stop_codon:yes gene_type:complete